LRIPYCGDNEERRCIFIGDIIFYQSYFLEYSRKKIEITDVLATIGALASTLNFVFSLIYKFYSKNFDNYKIIQNILQPNNINNINRKFKSLELNNIININSPLIDEKQEKEIEAKIDKKNNINNDDNLEKNINNDDNLEKYDKEIIQAENINLPKLSFFDFFLVNLYNKKCCRNKRLEIIEQCNKIITQYTSIDLVLTNMIKLDNLFIDYKWNNPNLKNIRNNELLKNLNSSLINYD